VIRVEEGTEQAVSEVPEGAEGHHAEAVEESLNPAPVEALIRKLDSPGKKMATGIAVGVFVIVFFVFAYTMGLASMKNSAAVSREAAAATAAAALPVEAPASGWSPDSTIGAAAAPATAVSTEPVPVAVAAPAEAPAAEQTTVSPGTASSGSDKVLPSATTLQTPGSWKVRWSGSGKASATTAWRSGEFKLAAGFVRASATFADAGSGVTVSLARVSPGIGLWALWAGDTTASRAITSDPRSIDAGTYRIEVTGDVTFKLAVEQ
jgi:hypothetical protein